MKLDAEYPNEDYFEIDPTNALVKETVQLAQGMGGVNLIHKGYADIITNGKRVFLVKNRGSLKRCGGIGDCLAGLSSLYTYWSTKYGREGESEDRVLYGCILGSFITRDASFRAF